MNISRARLGRLYLRGSEFWTGFWLSVVGMVILLVLFLLWRYEHQFAVNAVEVVAKVTGKEKRKEKGGKGGNSLVTIHYLDFTFQDRAGGRHSGSLDVPADVWERAKPADDLTIEYDRTDPEKYRLAGHFSTMPPLAYDIAAAIGLLFTSVGLVHVGYTLIPLWRRVRLIRTGAPAIGTVTDIVENQSISLNQFFSTLKAGRFDLSSARVPAGTYCVAYQFTDPAGATLDGKGPSQPYSLAYRWKPGDAVLVLYYPGNSSRHEADLFETRSDELADLQEQMEEEAE